MLALHEATAVFDIGKADEIVHETQQRRTFPRNVATDMMKSAALNSDQIAS